MLHYPKLPYFEAMGAVLSLVLEPAISLETIEVLAALLVEAQRGDVIGLAFVAMHKPHEVSADSVGELRKVPSLARGLLMDLSDEIALAARQK